MKKTLFAATAVIGLAFAGPAMAACEEDLMAAEAALDGPDVSEMERAEAAALIDEARAAHEAGDEAACLAAATEAASIVGAEPEADQQ